MYFTGGKLHFTAFLRPRLSSPRQGLLYEHVLTSFSTLESKNSFGKMLLATKPVKQSESEPSYPKFRGKSAI